MIGGRASGVHLMLGGQVPWMQCVLIRVLCSCSKRTWEYRIFVVDHFLVVRWWDSQCFWHQGLFMVILNIFWVFGWWWDIFFYLVRKFLLYEISWKKNLGENRNGAQTQHLGGKRAGTLKQYTRLTACNWNPEEFRDFIDNCTPSRELWKKSSPNMTRYLQMKLENLLTYHPDDILREFFSR